ncbi:polysaccharide deacetylase [Aliidiomarina taiwanensis]|uniref:Polysaccharide deacetylase n=1 Tax=Aliidiomarina taiwanensis TaxID=946228 RepID=A0A432X7B2_9GAMM|nr:polysaccharide deacetylase family protein [Aliidiomarina taiwanensis]RUO42712.1 polysaccharide deacetylase [Aliidiomarina taiwanensis]
MLNRTPFHRLARAISLFGLLLFSASTYAQSVSILLYHHVSETTPRVTSVSPDELRSHLGYLRDNNFAVIDLHHALAGMRGEKELPEKSVVITFDDAYQNIFNAARPILKEFNMPWALFVSTDFIGDTPGHYMSWTQLQTLHQEGVVIANHSSDHAHLPMRKANESNDAWRTRVVENIENAQALLEQHVGIQHKLFAYPYGEYDNALKAIVKELGYTAFGQHSGGAGPRSDMQAIPRFAAAGIYSNINTLDTKMAALNFPVTNLKYEDTLLAYHETKPYVEVEMDTADIHTHQVQCFISGEIYKPEWLSETRFRVQTNKDLPVGRSRYNCTAPSKSLRGRYYWFSMQWIRQDQQGQWPD